jgi:carboxypeptidase Taq
VEHAFVELKDRLATIVDLARARNVLAWDMEVYMPPNGADARGTQRATLTSLIHRQLTDDRIGELLDEVEPWAATLPGESDDACLVRMARRQFDKNRRIPNELAAEFTKVSADAFGTWVKAREESDFSSFRPSLERILELKLRMIECFAPYEDAYDVLVDDFEEGLRSEDITRVFDALQPELTALVEDHAGERDDFLRGPFDVTAQDALSREVITAFGVDWSSFRLDLTVHPFAVPFGLGDVRLTTRYDEDDVNALFTAMHEAGHGLYEFGSSPALDRTTLVGCRSSSLHESQSRLWENLVGRSLPFWRWFYPRVQETFRDRLGGVPLEAFHAAINRPVRSFIRVDADETSYGLHVILRYELERRLVSGELSVADLPDAWNSRFEELLGLEVPEDRLGVLQDSHWASGYFGYFPTYLLGSVLSVQIWERAAEAIPDLSEQIERGELGELHGWLRENLYALGSKFTPAETIERAAGGPIEPGPYLEYLRGKLGALSAA